ncbi:MAG: glycerate kinase, partial [Bacteroidales bacterium]|nr:glycerate kinase [Bacteroidales bacterium]
MTSRILIVPDKFKCAASASQVADALEAFLRSRSVRGHDPRHLTIEKLPLADGGDGSLEVLRSALGDECRVVSVPAEDALGRPVEAPVLLFGDSAFIEMAKVCGLAMLSFEERNPEITSTRGLGLVMKAAAGMGVSRIILGIGGSATNDGGAGMLETCPPSSLAGIDILVACDVENPLLGPNGATMVYSAQKGADAAMQERLERRMEEFARSHGIDASVPGGGAAGGVGAALHSLYGAKLTPGWRLFGDMVHLEEKIAEADLVLTAEGRVDGQSLNGKLLTGISSLCIKYRKVLKVVCGKSYLHPKMWRKSGIYDIFALSEVEPDIRKSIEGTVRLLSGEGLMLAGCDEAGRGCLAGP